MPQSDPRPGEFYLHFKQKLYQVTAVAKHSETGELMVVYQALYGTFQTYVQPLERFISPVDRGRYPDVRQKYRFQLAELKVLEKPQVKQEQEKPSVSARQGNQMQTAPEPSMATDIPRKVPQARSTSESSKVADIPRRTPQARSTSESLKVADIPRQVPQAKIAPEPSKVADIPQQTPKMKAVPEPPKVTDIPKQTPQTKAAPEPPKVTDISKQTPQMKATPEPPKELGSPRQVSPAQTALRRAGGVSRSQEEKMMAFLDAETMQEKYEILLEMQNDITDRMINNMAVALDVVIEEGPLDLRYEDLKACVRTFQRYEINELRKR